MCFLFNFCRSQNCIGLSVALDKNVQLYLKDWGGGGAGDYLQVSSLRLAENASCA